MQKIFSSVLNNFINQFQLSKGNGMVIFDSIVKFENHSKSIELPCSVHIITLENQHMNVIYLSFSDSENNSLPDMFPISENSDIGILDSSLLIHGNSRMHGQFKIGIKPIKIPVGAKENGLHKLLK